MEHLQEEGIISSELNFSKYLFLSFKLALFLQVQLLTQENKSVKDKNKFLLE